MSDALVYKICPRTAWHEAEQDGAYRGSADDRRDGFIHLSTASQVPGTASKYFRGQTDLVLVAIDASAVSASLRYEPSRGGEWFPHLYADLPVTAVRWVKELSWDGDAHVIPPSVSVT
ncbi:MAG TPA: DUF952 domain-containing protein [Polyangiaceae bacterium]|nr:DUF952 domain-containing protein [Polyangiaceae bacterium]